ncbi:hypothetical protein FQN57_004020 [Myotisia sp. PD_48]|nr:hypothetical protein FQN57_004020 [Myotisia sp. PD_48]
MVTSTPKEPSSPRAVNLFENTSFWLSKKIPQRRFLEAQIKKFGGNVVTLEKDADVLLVDDHQKHNPSGTHSYKFIEQSILSGKFLDLQEFVAGPPPGTIRPVGSSIPAKRTRRPFTAEDDLILDQWIQRLGGKGATGNKAYERLALAHPQHTWQSWRHRYLKKRYTGQPEPDQEKSLESPLGSPPQVAEGEGGGGGESSSAMPIANSPDFTESDKRDLLAMAKFILGMDPAVEEECWSEYAEEKGKHSALEWKNYFHTFVRPEYETKRKVKKLPRMSSLVPSSIDKSTAPDAPPRGTQNRTTSKQPDTDDKSNSVIVGATVKPATGGKRPAINDIRDSQQGTPIHISSPASPSSPGSQNPTNDDAPTPTQAHTSPSSSKAKGKLLAGPCITPTRRLELENYHETIFNYIHLHDLFQEPTQVVQDLFRSLPVPRPDSETIDDEGPEAALLEIQEFEKWVDSRLRDANGLLTETEVLRTLLCTSMNTVVADKALVYLMQGYPIPENMRGVWTDQDDEDFQGTDSRSVERIQQKHGQEYCDERFQFLHFKTQAMAEYPID